MPTRLLLALFFIQIAACSDDLKCGDGVAKCVSQAPTPPDLCADVDCGPGSCDPDTGTCSCPAPYSGNRCEEFTEAPCDFGPCGEHGMCRSGDDPTDYTCVCDDGWTGTRCELPQDRCAGVDCGPGTCNSATGTCSCPELNPGDRCEGFIDPACFFVGTCNERGTCIQGDTPTDYTCMCDEGWTGTHCEREAFEPIPPAPSSLSAGALGAGHACAVRAGALYCWGDNARGQLGVGDLVAREAPTLVVGMDAGVTAVKAGAAHTCAIKGDALYCWGEGADGQSGGANAPEVVAGFDAGVTALALGDAHTCAIKAGEVWCWGRNDVGQLGDGTTAASAAPREVVGLGAPQTRLASGAAHVCADDGCWGDNAQGQLGISGMAFSAFAVAADADHLGGARSCRIDAQSFDCAQMSAPRTTQVVAAALGAEHVCLVASNALKCWGDNAKGQLGVAALASSDMFVTVVDQPPSLLFAGFDSTCAAFGEELRCWGDNTKGQLGVPSSPTVTTPTAVIFP